MGQRYLRLTVHLSALAAIATIAPGCGAPSRKEIIATAQRYVDHEWRGGRLNQFHGRDRHGVRVDTPDRSFQKSGWSTGKRRNVGIPYQWGGFSSIDGFDRGVAKGRPAGHVTKDIDWSRPPRHSRYPVGVDCSGFISRCWDLRKKRSTTTLPRICIPLRSYSQLLPGDILNLAGRHVMLFKEFVDPKKTRIRVYEAQHAKGRCVESTYAVADLRKSGYRPLRYKRLVDD